MFTSEPSKWLLRSAVILAATFAFAAQDPPPSNPAALTPEAVLFEELPMVEAASLHVQSLQEAPATVTVITAQEIRKYGFRTLGEALSNVRGFHLTSDGVYQHLGSRGFSLPGDFCTRILVMLNGHYLTESIFGSNNSFEQDFALDMDLIRRIEVVRGPSSALYGSNGLFATINIVTKSPLDHPLSRVSAEFGAFGDKKLQVSSSAHFGKGVNLLLSASAFYRAGRSVYFQEMDRPSTNDGVADRIEGEQGQHSFANLLWRDWTITAMYGNRLVLTPQGRYATVFNDPGNAVKDSRGFVEALYSRDFGDENRLQWRLYYDRFQFWGRYDTEYEGDGVIWDNRDWAIGDAAGSRLTYSFPVARSMSLTLGGEFNADIRRTQRNGDVYPERFVYANVNTPDRTFAVFSQLQWNLSRRWTGYVTSRIDASANYGRFFSPRIAFVYQHSPKTTYKILYGKAFRNPSVFEAFYEVPPINISNPLLNPEKMQTLEVVAERQLTKQVNVVASVFHYRLIDLIQGVQDADDFVQFRNTASVRSTGAEFELNGRPTEWLEAGGSFTHQSVSDGSYGIASVNSPRSMAKFRFSLPIVRNRLDLSAASRHLSARRTLAGNTVDPVTLLDLTASTTQLHRNFDLVFGARNLLGRRYWDPVGPEHVSDRLLQPGRTLFVKLIWQYEE